MDFGAVLIWGQVFPNDAPGTSGLVTWVEDTVTNSDSQDAQFCVQVQVFEQTATNPIVWSPVGGIQYAITETGQNSFTVPANGQLNFTVGSRLELTTGTYKQVVSIYPVPVDQMETYAGDPVWTGSTITDVYGQMPPGP